MTGDKNTRRVHHVESWGMDRLTDMVKITIANHF